MFLLIEEKMETSKLPCFLFTCICIHFSAARFISNNYKQATKLQSELVPKLQNLKVLLNIESDDVFQRWQDEELSFLKDAQGAVVTERERLEEEYVSWLRDHSHAV